MAQVYFLVPGLIPGPSAKDIISGATIDRLRKTIGRFVGRPRPAAARFLRLCQKRAFVLDVVCFNAPALFPLPPLLMPGLSKTDRCSQETSGP